MPRGFLSPGRKPLPHQPVTCPDLPGSDIRQAQRNPWRWRIRAEQREDWSGVGGQGRARGFGRRHLHRNLRGDRSCSGRVGRDGVQAERKARPPNPSESRAADQPHPHTSSHNPPGPPRGPQAPRHVVEPCGLCDSGEPVPQAPPPRSGPLAFSVPESPERHLGPSWGALPGNN